MKPSAPRYSFGKGTRDQLDKVFLSHTAEKTKGNKDTPGAIYDVPSDLGRAQSFSFSKAPQRVHMKQKYPDSSIDLIETIVDSGYVKFDNQPAFYFGTEAKDCMKNSAITRNHQSASMGVIGPGPAGYLPDAKSHLEGQPTYPFGVKTKFGSMFAYQGSTPLQVGPGKYKLQKATGKQSLSTRATLPAWGFGKGKRFPTSEPDLTIIDPSPNRKAMGSRSCLARDPRRSLGSVPRHATTARRLAATYCRRTKVLRTIWVRLISPILSSRCTRRL
jgi:hypothetical protein